MQLICDLTHIKHNYKLIINLCLTEKSRKSLVSSQTKVIAFESFDRFEPIVSFEIKYRKSAAFCLLGFLPFYCIFNK
jgi:hypothetical protein